MSVFDALLCACVSLCVRVCVCSAQCSLRVLCSIDDDELP